MPRAQRRQRPRARPLETSEWVSSISKMRSAAAIACCRLAFTRLSFLIGVYIMNAATMNAEEVARSSAAWRESAALPYHSSADDATPPRNSISGGSTDDACW